MTDTNNVARHRTAIGRATLSRPMQIALASGLIDRTAGVLDYGCGDGGFLRRVHASEPRAALCGFEPRGGEPSRSLFDDLPTLAGVFTSLDEISNFRPTKIACLEVLEHLHPEAQEQALTALVELLAPNGLAIVSVPIEIGPVSVFKNVARKAINQPHRGITLRNTVLSLLGMTRRIERDFEEAYIASHIGFDYRDLQKIVRARGVRFTRHYSPFPGLGPWGNSQVFFVLRPVRE